MGKRDIASFLRPAVAHKSKLYLPEDIVLTTDGAAKAAIGDIKDEKPANPGRATYRAALRIASSKSCLSAAVESLKKDFWAESARNSRDAKRKFVVELVKTIGGEWWSPPLCSEMILKAAAAVKEAKLKSGPAIINDLKLWHVEQGFEVPEWMARMFKLVKKVDDEKRRATEKSYRSAKSRATREAVDSGSTAVEGDQFGLGIRMGYNVDASLCRDDQCKKKPREGQRDGEDRHLNNPDFKDGSKSLGYEKNPIVLQETEMFLELCVTVRGSSGDSGVNWTRGHHI